MAPHQRLELAQIFVIDKEFLGQFALIAQHVDQKPKSAQAIAQFVKNSGARGLNVNIVHQELLDTATHAQRGQCRLVQSQYRENTAHLGQLTGHLVQRHFVQRVAKERIQRFFNFTQIGAQLVHHTAHDLTITDAAVQLFHPPFKRLGFAARIGKLKTPCQTGAALDHVRVGRVQVFVGGFKVQHNSGHFHGQCRGWRLTRSRGSLDRLRQGARQVPAFGMQLQHGVDHQAELIGCHFQAIGVAAGQRRPGFGGRCDALARLHQQGGIEPAKLRGLVIKRLGLGQAICGTHR